MGPTFALLPVMTLFNYRLWPLLKRTGSEIWDDDVPELAASAAYNFFLAIFPLLLFLAPLLALTGNKEETMFKLLDSFGRSLPPAAFDLFRKMLMDVVFAQGAPGLMSVGVIGALWAGSNIFATLTSALNVAFDVTETRPWWRRRLLAIAAAIGSGIVILTTTIVLVGSEQLAVYMGLGAWSLTLFNALQYPAAGLILIVVACLCFMVLPNVRVRWTHALAGATATVALWLLVTVAFHYYVQNVGNYNATYGTIGGVIVLLIWMYISMIALLSGGELSSELHLGTGAVAAGSSPIDARTGRLSTTPAFAVSSTERINRIDPLAPDSP